VAKLPERRAPPRQLTGPRAAVGRLAGPLPGSALALSSSCSEQGHAKRVSPTPAAILRQPPLQPSCPAKRPRKGSEDCERPLTLPSTPPSAELRRAMHRNSPLSGDEPRSTPVRRAADVRR